MTDAPALVSIGAETLVERARALGLTWSLRPGTIVNAPGGTETLLLYDGDTVPINYISLTGFILLDGQRVMGMIVPPAGNFVIGYVDDSLPAGVVGYGASQSSTSSISSETVFATAPDVTFVDGRAYRIRVSCSLDPDALVPSSGAVQVRKSSTAGAVILSARGWENVVPIGGKAYEQQGIVINVSGADITTTVVATIDCVPPQTVTVRGLSDNARELEIEDMGLASRFPNAVQIS